MPFPVPSRIAEALRQSTVEVRTGGRRANGSGSGVVLQGARVLTNAHVIHGTELHIEWDGGRHPASLVKKDDLRDLALVSVPGLAAPPAILASDPPSPGQPVIAVGNPMGFAGAISSGTVIAVGMVRGLGPRSWIQADVRLAPGNSGGPLADRLGHVLGINTMVAGGMALAIPAQAVQAFLSASAPAQRRQLGVVIRPVRYRANSARAGFGLLLLEVSEASAAERASLLAGDLLIAANGRPLEGPDDLAAALAGGGNEKSPESLTLEFYRGETANLRRVTVQLPPLASSRGAGAGRAVDAA